MLKRLKLIASSIVVISTVTIVYAKDIPITQEVQLTIPLGSFSVIEFPFEITSRNITSFMPVRKIKKTTKVINKVIKEQESINDDFVRKPIPKKVKKKSNESLKKRSKYISITNNVNSLTFFTRKEGQLKMVIWGYDHPILLTIKVAKEDGYGSYKFLLPLGKNQDVLKTEQDSHEKIINKLMIHLFNQTLPKGYKSKSTDKNYISNGFSLRLNRSVIGKRYMGEEWILTNHTSIESTIHEESFSKKGVYGVSLEADTLMPDESVRVFIVRAASKKPMEKR